jgi:GxxExxY protein
MTDKLTTEEHRGASQSYTGVEHELTSRIIGCAMKVHSRLGPGLLESAYKECLCYELQRSGLRVKKEVPMPLIYDDVKLSVGYRIDILVEEKVVIEVKVVEAFSETHIAQTLTYLKLSGCRVGLLINFHVAHLKNGIKRLIL